MARPSSAPNANWILATCILGSSLSFIDGSVVNVGLPAIAASLKARPDGLPWVINAYLLPLGALLLTGGAAGDRFGRNRLLIIGTALFGAASLGCAIAPNLPVLLAARAVQGIGAAILQPNSLAILGVSFEGEARGRAVGIWAAAGAVLGAIGPVLGGWLIDTFGWRTIFLINLPLAVGAILLALRFIKDLPRDDKTSVLDVPGAILATAGLGAITAGLTFGAGAGGWTRLALGLSGAGLGLILAFIAVEHRRKDKAMMPLSLFGSRTFTGLTGLTLLLYGALGALLVLLPYVLIRVAHYSSTMAGLSLLPFAAIMALASPITGAIAGKTGPKLPLTLGPLLVAGGFLWLLGLNDTAVYWAQVLPAVVIMALGMAMAVAPLTSAVLSSVDASHTGSASGLNTAVARVAGMIATALLGGVLGLRGAALIGGFHAAIVVCALAAVGAAGCAALLISGGRAPDVNRGVKKS
jgi:EmrB/QacA subfamily drug resistance transporter